MICPNCKKRYSDDNIFCVDCGGHLVVEKSSETPIERFSTRVKTSRQNDVECIQNNKLNVLILQNEKLINQNTKLIKLLERLIN